MVMNTPKMRKNSLIGLLFEERLPISARKDLNCVIKWPIYDINHFVLTRDLVK